MKLKGNRVVLLLLVIFSIVAQENSYSQPPWVKGSFPNIINNGFYKVERGEANRLLEARKQAQNSLIMDIAAQKGVKISARAINEMRSKSLFSGNKETYEESDINKQVTRIKRDDFEAVFSKVDEYYEYKNGTYHLWVLYLVSEDGKELRNVPTLAYKVNNGAWRSLLVPGWAQFYTKQPVKGSLFLGGEAALLGSGFYLYNRASYNNIRSQEAHSIKIKQEYRNRAKSYKTYSYITWGVAAGWYLYNVIDAFSSKKGKMIYDYKNMNLTFTPTIDITNDNYVLAGVCIQF